jgi:di/tricarboxylate transporter
MTLGIRKLIVVSLVGGVFLLANFLWITSWLQEKGVIDWAKDVRKEYLTGTTITIIIVLLILLIGRRGENRRLLKRCPVCDHRLLGSATYCSDCGSKL